VIGGASTVSGAVFGALVVTFAFEGLRAVEASLNRAQVFAEQVVGLTEVALALAMIGILILRPGGLFATAEIGAALRLPRAAGSQRPPRRAPEEPASSNPIGKASP
jgi:branched-chain amino acid transport system permease protein